MSVSSFSSAAKPGVCLSTDRPDAPFDGQVIYETDTNRTLVYDNSAWVVIHDPTLMSYSGTGVTVTADAATIGGENVTPYTGRRNLLYNGAMQVAQRGTSFTVGGSETYTVDRWKSVSASGATLSKSTDAPSGFSSSVDYACTTAQGTATNETFVSQVLEGQDVQQIGYGATDCNQLSVSFWVKSNVTGTFNVWFYRWDGSRHIGRSYTINSADTWEYKTVLVPADTSNAVANDNTSGLEIRFYLAAQSTWTGGTEASSWSAVSDNNRAPGNVNINSSTSNYWRVTGVQLELGDKATPFEHRSVGEELALCQRYYEKSYIQSHAPGTATYTGAVTTRPWTTTSAYTYVTHTFAVTKRTTPTITIYSVADGSAGYWFESGFGNRSGGADNHGESGFNLRNTVVLAGTGHIFCHWVAEAEL